MTETTVDLELSQIDAELVMRALDFYRQHCLKDNKKQSDVLPLINIIKKLKHEISLAEAVDVVEAIEAGEY